MAYGQINTSSGRSLTLTPDLGWVNGQGQQMVPNSGGMSLADLGNGGVTLDYANPIEIGGVGKGYRIKGDPFTAVLNDGRRVQIGVDSEASRKATLGNLEVEKARLNNQLTLAQLAAAGRKEGPTFQHVDTPQGPMAFNPRTGEYSAIQGTGGQPIQSKEQAQRSQDATSVMELTDQAAPLVDKAPGSYLGAGANHLGRAFGMDTDATKAQAQLDVLAGALISKMPKMSGPQSDKDVAMYKQMAGNLNDPTLPASAKMAAMNTLRDLNRKYATGYQEQQSAQPAKSGAVSQALNEAKAAIAAGAPRDAVIRRLQQLGVSDIGGL